MPRRAGICSSESKSMHLLPPQPTRAKGLCSFLTAGMKTGDFVQFLSQSWELSEVKLLCMSLAPMQSELGGSLVCSDRGKHHFWGLWGIFLVIFIELWNLRLHLSLAVTSYKTRHRVTDSQVERTLIGNQRMGFSPHPQLCRAGGDTHLCSWTGKGCMQDFPA